MFASDFGYGKLYDKDVHLVCRHMIENQRRVPILLSHWDLDHYRIAKSAIAGDFTDKEDCVGLRAWVAPGKAHIRGLFANDLAWSIQQNEMLYQWTDDIKNVKFGNICVIRCNRNWQYKDPDKNNFGALALVVGKGENLLLYPGDANFESIPGIQKMNGNVRTVIATHHGSTTALWDGLYKGGSIPKASSGSSYALFSYAKNNHFGHDARTAFPMYKNKGYRQKDATELLVNGEDTLEITHFINEPETVEMMAALELQKDVGPAESHAMETEKSGKQKRPTKYSPGLGTSRIPDLPPDWKKKADSQPLVHFPSHLPTHFPSEIRLMGSIGSTKPILDDLSTHAIRDEWGDIVMYSITATKIVIGDLPLRVPCNTDYPVAVQITCQDIEINISESDQSGPIPLVRFDVGSGEEWLVEANPGQDGRSGNPGHAGGRLRLAVAHDWVIRNPSRTLYNSARPAIDLKGFPGFSIQYRGGKGGNGQRGGVGLPGTNGRDGSYIAIYPFENRVSKSDPAAEAGTDGVDGGRGGNAGCPGTIADSEVLAMNEKWPGSWKVVIDSRDFGAVGSAGKGISPFSPNLLQSPAIPL